MILFSLYFIRDDQIRCLVQIYAWRNLFIVFFGSLYIKVYKLPTKTYILLNLILLIVLLKIIFEFVDSRSFQDFIYIEQWVGNY